MPHADVAQCPWVADEAPDPSVAAEQHEWRERFQQVLGKLEPKLRQLWDALAARKQLAVIADELHMSLSKVKRLQTELHTMLIAAMGEGAGLARA